MTDHANELRRYARKIAHPAGDVPSVMLAAADEIERLAARLEATEEDRSNFLVEMGKLCAQCDALRAKITEMEQQAPIGTAHAMQDALMKFDPATGEERPYPSHATQWRNWHGIAAWLFDPWTGRRRNAYDVGSDVHGLLIAPAGTLGRDMGGSCAEKNNVAGAQPAPSVPDGWKLVPIEPTEDMLRAMTDPFIAINGDNRKAFEIAYTAMLEAAPEAKP